MSEQIKIGTKVRTAAVLRRVTEWPAAIDAARRPDALGEVYGFPSPPNKHVMVVHADGTRAPYFRDELTPIPDEKAAPTTPIGRLRATICDVTGAVLYRDQWDKIDAGLREVEGAMIADANALQLALAQVETLKGQIFNRALMAGEVGPMPVEKAAEPWTGAAGRIDRAYEAVTDPDGHEVGPAAWELEAASVLGDRKPDPLVALHAERRDLERARRTRTLYLPEATRLEALTAEIDRLEVEEARQRGEAWTRSEPVKPARPRVGGWVIGSEGRVETIYDAHGFVVANTWERDPRDVGGEWSWNAHRPYREPAGGRASKEAAKAAAVAVLATWADVEGQPEATVETWPCDLCGQPMVSEPAKAPAPPLSLVVAFGSEGAPVILEAAGPWEGIADRPLPPPARGLWRWVGKATREPDEQVGGHDFEGTWTALSVPA